MEKKLKSYIYKSLDIGIAPLVHAMNETGWIMTYSSCEGHSTGCKYPNVSFWCKADKVIIINEIIERLKLEFNKQYPEFIKLRTNITCENQYLEWKSFLWFEFNTDEIDKGGWTSLNMMIRSYDPTKKSKVIKQMTNCFKDVNRYMIF